MAHEIGTHDHVVLHKQAAWHGLGTIVEDAPTPSEALKLARLDWHVSQFPLLARQLINAKDEAGNDIVREDVHAVPTHVVNVRMDTLGQLGVVTTNYQPVQNQELADFAGALAENGDTVKIESAGSIRNGQKVWFLLKGESFSIRCKGKEDDEIKPYICISNGHDGMSAMRCTPTTVRVVCSNTLHMVIPSRESEGLTGRAKIAGFALRHIGNVMQRVEEAKKALNLYGKSLKDTVDVIDAVAAKEVTRELVESFFLQCYTHDFGSIPMNPTDAKEAAKKAKAMEACNAVFGKFDEESKNVGANLWAAVNAYTGWLQHDLQPRIKNVELATESKVQSRLFGTDAQRSHHTLEKALAMAV